MSNAQNNRNREADIDHCSADAITSTELWGRQETELETGRSMKMMEPLVTL